jgi:hypothetical protein
VLRSGGLNPVRVFEVLLHEVEIITVGGRKIVADAFMGIEQMAFQSRWYFVNPLGS